MSQQLQKLSGGLFLYKLRHEQEEVLIANVDQQESN